MGAPFTAIIKSPSLAPTPISVSGERNDSTQFPLRIYRCDSSQTVAAQSGPQQALLNAFRRRFVAPIDISMTYIEFPDKLANNIIQVVAVIYIR